MMTCTGVRYTHEQGIAHLDIKLENVIVNELRLTLVDFGLSVQGNLLCRQYGGSADYASPEILKKIPYLPLPSDIWSAGIVLFVILTGGFPFDPYDLVRMTSSPALPWPEEVNFL